MKKELKETGQVVLMSCDVTENLACLIFSDRSAIKCYNRMNHLIILVYSHVSIPCFSKRVAVCNNSLFHWVAMLYWSCIFNLIFSDMSMLLFVFLFLMFLYLFHNIGTAFLSAKWATFRTHFFKSFWIFHYGAGWGGAGRWDQRWVLHGILSRRTGTDLCVCIWIKLR